MVKETPKKVQRQKVRYHPNAEDKITIISYYERLKDYREVSKASQWSLGVVGRVLKRWKEEKSTDRKPGQGRKREITLDKTISSSSKSKGTAR